MDIKSWLHIVLEKYHDSDRTFRDVDTVLELYKTSLKPKMDTYTYNDGKTELLLCIHGTVPITYHSSPYNIPVAFWIPNEYPHCPPIPYVKPTASMVIREGKHVDKSGLCYHPYRSTWSSDVNNHTLLKLIAILQQVFGENPPLYTKPDTVSYPKSEDWSMSPSASHTLSSPSSMPTPQLGSSPATTGADARSRRAGETSPFANINQGVAGLTLSPSPYTPPALSAVPTTPVTTLATDNIALSKSASLPIMSSALPPTGHMSPRLTSAEETNHDRLFRKVSERLELMKLDVERLSNVNRQLREGEAVIEQQHLLLKDVYIRLQRNMKELETKLESMDTVIRKVTAIPVVEVDEALCGTRVVYNQLFELVADDNAIGDTIYELSSALKLERIDLVTFTKHTRKLAREQFMRRALIKKIVEAVNLAAK